MTVKVQHFSFLKFRQASHARQFKWNSFFPAKTCPSWNFLKKWGTSPWKILEQDMRYWVIYYDNRFLFDYLTQSFPVIPDDLEIVLTWFQFQLSWRWWSQKYREEVKCNPHFKYTWFHFWYYFKIVLFFLPSITVVLISTCREKCSFNQRHIKH